MGNQSCTICLQEGCICSLPVFPKRLLPSAVFLPCAGNRNNDGSVNNAGANGNYWSSTVNDGTNAFNINFNSGGMNPGTNNNNRYNGFVVRVVQHPSQEKLLMDLFTAYYSARSNKRNTYNQVRFERSLSANLIRLYTEIRDRTYRPGRSVCFIIDRPVKREVFAASFRDRIVHHYLYNYLMPIFDPLFIYDSYSCRVGKGTRFGIQRLEHHIRSCSRNFQDSCWVLKLDLSGYFMSMDRQLLYDIVIRHLKGKGHERDPEYKTVVFLLKQIIFNDPTVACYRKGQVSDWDGLPPSKSLFHSREGTGLPIGNLTSQLFSNIYLNEFDQFVKRELKVKHYGRYVDDFYLVDTSRERLLSLIPLMRDYLDRRLFLRLHPRKMLLVRQEQGVPFLGCILKNGQYYPSARTRRMIQENLDRTYVYQHNPYLIRACVNSYSGFLAFFSLPSCIAIGYSATSQASMHRLSVEKRTPILKS